RRPHLRSAWGGARVVRAVGNGTIAAHVAKRSKRRPRAPGRLLRARLFSVAFRAMLQAGTRPPREKASPPSAYDPLGPPPVWASQTPPREHEQQSVVRRKNRGPPAPPATARIARDHPGTRPR